MFGARTRARRGTRAANPAAAPPPAAPRALLGHEGRAARPWSRRPLIVGERVNSQGSRKVKELLLADDYAGLLEIARGQVEAGAHVLDVCVALNEREDEAAQMRTLVSCWPRASTRRS